MPFPKLKVRFQGSYGSCPREVFMTDPETGVVTTRLAPCNERLPAAEMFKIENLIKAGVHLDEVNTKILSSGIDVENLHDALKITRSSMEVSDDAE